jgi:L-glutamine:2-deoxy-scyllo-inosose/3-amino-2,3-dideoxy-scyllo-inosose aminotransferase
MKRSIAVSDLALLGGTPVFDQALDWRWPPVDDSTAQKLQELYFSRRWSAFDDAEGLFAQAFASHHDAKHGIFTINGTVTLQCALGAYGIGAGDEVIIPPWTWYATAMAVHYVGAKPVFVDVDPNTLCIDPIKIEAAITSRTKAIIPVHLYGSMADMDRIMEIAKKHRLRVIEDCAHAHGGIWGARHIGSIGDVGSFSFQHTKTMGCADAGACITDNAEIAERIFRMKHIGYAPGEHPGNVRGGPPADLTCHNFRATAFPALILQEQLKSLDGRLDLYAERVRYLEARLRSSTRIRFQARGRRADRQGYYGWVMLFDDPSYADIPIAIIQKAIAAEGLSVLQTWNPVYRFVLFNLRPDTYRIDQPCLVTERLVPRTLWLLHAYLGYERHEVERIGDIIEKVMGNVDALRRHAKTMDAAVLA